MLEYTKDPFLSFYAQDGGHSYNRNTKMNGNG